MSNLAKVAIAILVFFVLGGIAKGFNEAHHEEMAKKECGSTENIEHFDSKGFTCKTPSE